MKRRASRRAGRAFVALADVGRNVEQLLHRPAGHEQRVDVDARRAVGDEVDGGKLGAADAAVGRDREHSHRGDPIRAVILGVPCRLPIASSTSASRPSAESACSSRDWPSTSSSTATRWPSPCRRAGRTSPSSRRRARAICPGRRSRSPSRRPSRARSRLFAGHVASFDPDVVHLHSSKAGLVGRLVVRGSRPTDPAAALVVVLGAHGRDREGDARVGAVRGALALRGAVRQRGRAQPGDRGGDPRRLPRDAERGGPGAVRAGRPRGGAGGVRHRQRGALDGVRGSSAPAEEPGALLDAWPRVRGAVPDARLVLLGDGPDRPELEQRAVEGVELAGSTDDVRPWLAAANVIAQPSRWEGMSLSLLEALAAGRSVVVTDVTGMREVVVDGVGAVVPPDDSGALADALVGAAVRSGAGRRGGRRGAGACREPPRPPRPARADRRLVRRARALLAAFQYLLVQARHALARDAGRRSRPRSWPARPGPRRRPRRGRPGGRPVLATAVRPRRRARSRRRRPRGRRGCPTRRWSRRCARAPSPPSRRATGRPPSATAARRRWRPAARAGRCRSCAREGAPPARRSASS